MKRGRTGCSWRASQACGSLWGSMRRKPHGMGTDGRSAGMCWWSCMAPQAHRGGWPLRPTLQAVTIFRKLSKRLQNCRYACKGFMSHAHTHHSYPLSHQSAGVVKCRGSLAVLYTYTWQGWAGGQGWAFEEKRDVGCLKLLPQIVPHTLCYSLSACLAGQAWKRVL